MAQTRTITRQKLAKLAVLDFASRSLRGIYRPGPPRQGTPTSFLVVEPWGIGDVVLSTALLRALRANFPGARISLLGKAHAEALLAHSGLADEIIPFDFPWTSFTEKFAPHRYVPADFRNLVHRLRQSDFDVSLDARRDIRSNIITYLGGVRRRIGYDFGGGAHLLTDAVASYGQNDHKISDWLALLEPLGVRAREDHSPFLALTADEVAGARERLRLLGHSGEQLLIGVHPGASHSVRRWTAERFAEVIDGLRATENAQVLIFEQAEGDSIAISPRASVLRIHADLRGFMALVSQCDVLLCSDSGPMHIAGALGVPVTALFGPQRREWYGPTGQLDNVVQVDVMPCRPCFDACIFPTPYCMDWIRTEDVIAAVVSQLRRLPPKAH